jgi:hypothetical protein
MEIDENMILISLHEPAMYCSYNQSDFRPPYTLHATSPEEAVMPSTMAMNINARAQLVTSAHNLTSAFASLSVQQLQAVPVITYAKMIYSITIIAKLEIFGTVQGSASEGKSQVWSLNNIVPQLLRNLAEAASQNRCIVPAIFHMVLLRIQNWYQSARRGEFEYTSGSIKPLMTLNLHNTDQIGSDDPSNTNSTNTTDREGHIPALEPILAGLSSSSPSGKGLWEIWGDYVDNSYMDPFLT